MLLDRIEIDSHGPLNRVEIGPLSHHLNLVLAPPGSGKTAISRFIRDSLVDRDYPTGMLSRSAGRVVWVDSNGWVHFRREQDGTPGGRRSVEFEPRSESSGLWDGYPDGWFDPQNDLHKGAEAGSKAGSSGEYSAARSLFPGRQIHGIQKNSSRSAQSLAGRAFQGVRIPESIVDGVVTDTMVSRVSHVVAACLQAGLEREGLAPLAFENETTAYSATMSGASAGDLGFAGADGQGVQGQYATVEPNETAGRDDHATRRRWRRELSGVETELARLDWQRDSVAAGNAQGETASNRQRWLAKRAAITRRREELRGRHDACVSQIDAIRRRRRDTSVLETDSFERTAPADAATNGRRRWSLEERIALADLDARRRHLEDELRLAEKAVRRCEAEATRYRDSAGDSPEATQLEHRYGTLKRRRDVLLARLTEHRPVTRGETSLAERASGWLIRLSGGRHHLVTWSTSAATVDPISGRDADPATDRAEVAGTRVHVQIDQRDESDYPAATRALASLAVRMAAGERLARIGRSVPLVVETHSELFRRRAAEANAGSAQDDGVNQREAAYQHWTGEGVAGDVLAAALSDYAAAGHQLLLLTSHRPLAESLSRSGARLFQLNSQRIVHPHRPLWRSGRREDRYVGPHGLDGVTAWNGLEGDPLERELDQVGSANRAFDRAWVEASGLNEDHPARTVDLPYASASAAGAYNGSIRFQPAVDPLAESMTDELHDDLAPPTHADLWDASDAPLSGEEFARYRSFRDGDNRSDADARRRFHRGSTFFPGSAATNGRHFHPAGQRDHSAQAVRPATTVTDAVRPGAAYRDGYYFADQTTSRGSSDGESDGSIYTMRDEITPAAETPFFLTVDSPIDAAPSIDAVASARLRRIGISHVTHLMNQDSNRLADTLGLAGVSAKTVRRWQSECRLMCRVPQLRGFDSRILVGCGINDPAQLAAIHPADLLERVKTFLATERGQRILLSGTSYELSRITSWIASANRSADMSRQVDRQSRHESHDTDRGHRFDDRSARHGSNRQRAAAKRPTRRDDDVLDARRVRRRTRRTERPVSIAIDDRPDSTNEQKLRDGREADEPRSGDLRFYLERSSKIVDAPSIGPRMAERLNRIGIITAGDLLTAKAADVAGRLRHRRVDADTVLGWQHQITLVCRIPMLRGHDAQLLVAAGVTTPEQVAEQDPEELFSEIDAIARSSEGKRIIRGGKLPDQDEVTYWVENARQRRPLRAA